MKSKQRTEEHFLLYETIYSQSQSCDTCQKQLTLLIEAAVCFFNKVSMAYRIFTQAGPVSTKSNLEAKANYKSSG